MQGVEILAQYGSREVEYCVCAVIMLFFIGMMGYGISGIREVFRSCGRISKAIVVPVVVLYIGVVGWLAFELFDAFYPVQAKYVVHVNNNVAMNDFFESYDVVENIGEQGYIVIPKSKDEGT